MAKKKYYPDVAGSPDFPAIEEKVLKSWQQEDTFLKSVEQRPAFIKKGEQAGESALSSSHGGGKEAGAGDKINNEYVFYDGPPFANGLPHYGHLLTSVVKDIDARYRTMKGHRVERRFGWDCHGLPAEMESEKELEVSGRKAIEAFGIDKFNDHCRESVMKYTGVWQDYINRAGRWVDFDNDYKTMDTDYMESVLWAFKQLYDKGLIYESYRVMPYSWAAQTPLSNFETRMDNAYREIEDKAITVAFKLKEVPEEIRAQSTEHRDVYLLAWTTTPWTLPSNLALAVSKEMEYVCVTTSLRAQRSNPEKEELDRRVADAPRDDERNCYILAKTSVEKYLNELGAKSEIVDEGTDLVYQKSFPNQPKITCLKGKKLLGLKYEPLFPYFAGAKNAFKILDGSDFIEEGEGTGVVHLAPGFGEDDQRVCEEAGIELVCPVDEAGRFTDEVVDLQENREQRAEKGKKKTDEAELRAPDSVLSLKGKHVFDTNADIIKYLKSTGAWIKTEQYKHSYPHCWRTDTPLIYKAVPSWYVEVTKFKDRMVELNKDINWIPEHIRDGQFGKWLENARDWSISRNRYWGTPIPVWRTESGKIKVFGSIQEMEEFFGPHMQQRTENKEQRTEKTESCALSSELFKIEDLHRPFIDTLEAPDPENPKETYRRVDDVFDCWFESGSMPFAQVHYPFENEQWFEEHFPADFIVEYVGQTRGWFYTLVVLATALFDRIPFKNCICHGVILDAEGKKLSKRLRNYPDPNEMFDTYGADAMRWRMVKEPVMHGGNLLISKDGSDIRDVVRLSIRPVWNAYNFFTLYANADGIKAELLFQGPGVRDQGSGKEEPPEPRIPNPESLNIMDRYILAKVKQAVIQIDDSLDKYLMPEACAAVDDFFEVLNNWYIRRNKDRFWKSEKDDDKQTAYNTLYTVLHIISRAAAPLLPFTLEAVFKGLSGEGSVHLQEFPSLRGGDADEAIQKKEETGSPRDQEAARDDELVQDMDLVRDACNAALAVRARENIRTRQPLNRMTVVGYNVDKLEEYKELLKDEVNVKEVEILYSEKMEEFGNFNLQLNFSILGKRLKEEGKADKMKKLTSDAKAGKWKKEKAGERIIAGEKIFEDEYEQILDAKDPKTTEGMATGRDLVVLDLELTDELIKEGLARDLVRMIQEARKQADLHISDRIELALEVDNGIREAAEENKKYIKEQTLALHLEFSSAQKHKHKVENEIGGKKITIGFSVAA